MLSILRVLDQHRFSASVDVPLRSTIMKDDFKIIYVYVEKSVFGWHVCSNCQKFSAPMKALVSEIVRKLGKRLQWLSIQVRELTGMFWIPVILNHVSDTYHR